MERFQNRFCRSSAGVVDIGYYIKGRFRGPSPGTPQTARCNGDHPVEGIRAAPGGAEKARSQILKLFPIKHFIARLPRAFQVQLNWQLPLPLPVGRTFHQHVKSYNSVPRGARCGNGKIGNYR